ncbi:MAG: DUF2207 domain-containing protein [Chitinophagaceae bacterium]|nr:DUF2207 domain-containing protein [Chitinophagaceae bacterium]
MRISSLILLFCCSVFFAAAQKKYQDTYYYTQASEKYFTDGEIDSLFRTAIENIFSQNAVPVSLLDKHYITVKSILAGAVRNNLIVSFKEIENKAKKNINADSGSQQYADNKKLYTDAFIKQVNNIFYTNKYLLPYISFNTGDRIIYFSSTVRVQTDGTLMVQETIKVNNGDANYHPAYGTDSALQATGALNDEIKRGIVRNFPLFYVNKYKLFQNTTFKVKQVLRNGQKEEYYTEKAVNGIKLFIGNKYRTINSGIHTYTIEYETGHQLKHLNKFDELYWNVTGNGWSFRMDSVSCSIILPKGAAPLSNKCYTGNQGSTAENCTVTVSTVGDSSIVVFKTTKSLRPQQGLTVATSWPKGFVKGPGLWQRIKFLIWNNKAAFLLPVAALFSIIFCFVFWIKYGRDPEKGTVYPLFEPPAGYSPAELGYIYFQEYSSQLTAATIVDAAVRNNIKIDVERDGLLFKHNEYVFSKADKKSKPPATNYNDFWSDVNDLVDNRIEKGKYNKNLADLAKSIRTHCEARYKSKPKNKLKGLFMLNDGYMALPGIVCFLTGIWALIETMGAAVRKNYWQAAYFVAGIFLCSLIFKLFAKLLKAYTPEGRKMRDSIEGFHMFLATADEQRFDTMNPPKKSLELYEKYLPFAIALGCEVEWGNKFEEIIKTAELDNSAVSSFSYSSRSFHKNMGSSFAASFGGAISSASTPPSSSSGGGSSFGGGSSGGGGGGGGGGGW